LYFTGGKKKEGEERRERESPNLEANPPQNAFPKKRGGKGVQVLFLAFFHSQKKKEREEKGLLVNESQGKGI